MERRKFIKYATLSSAGLSFAGCNNNSKSNSPQSQIAIPASPVVANEPLKVGFVYASSVGDFGWTYAHDLGRREMEANLKGKVETTFVENVSESVDAPRVIRQLALDGNKLIFMTSLGYMNSTLKVASSFPKVAFEQLGYKKATNVGTYLGRFEESRYLTGIIAGKMTKSNIIGFIAASPTPEVIREIGAFTQGIRLTNSLAKVRVIWVKSLYNPVKEREAAQKLVSLGADILAQQTDSAAIVQLAEEKGIYAFAHNTDMSKFGQKTHLTSAINQWGKFYIEKALAVMNGTWKSEEVWQGIAQGFVDISPMNPIIPQDVQKLVNDKRDGIIKGTAHPFDGPVKDQKGVIRVPKGQVLDDKEQLGMDWYVEGVEVVISKSKI